MFFVYILLFCAVAYFCVYCMAASAKNKIDVQRDEEFRDSTYKLLDMLNVSNDRKYEYLMSMYKSLEKSLPMLEKTARTIEQFAEVDRIKRNMKILLEECDKLKPSKTSSYFDDDDLE